MATPGIYTVIETVDKPEAWILLMHGLADHSARYDHVARAFMEHQWSVVRYDHHAHGRSAGIPGYVPRFDILVQDYQSVLSDVRSLAGKKPVFVVAHSMGALVAVTHAIAQDDLQPDGMVTIGVLAKVNEDLSPLLQKVSGLLSLIVPRLQTLKLDQTRLSRDPAILKIAEADPLHYKSGIRARTGGEILKATKDAQSKLQVFKLPLLLLHGGADAITKPDASQLMYDQCNSKDKTLKIYPGAYHELLHETNRDQVIHDISAWISRRAADQLA